MITTVYNIQKKERKKEERKILLDDYTSTAVNKLVAFLQNGKNINLIDIMGNGAGKQGTTTNNCELAGEWVPTRAKEWKNRNIGTKHR